MGRRTRNARGGSAGGGGGGAGGGKKGFMTVLLTLLVCAGAVVLLGAMLLTPAEDAHTHAPQQKRQARGKVSVAPQPPQPPPPLRAVQPPQDGAKAGILGEGVEEEDATATGAAIEAAVAAGQEVLDMARAALAAVGERANHAVESVVHPHEEEKAHSVPAQPPPESQPQPQPEAQHAAALPPPLVAQAQEAPSGKERIHFVTYASHGGRDDRFCRMVESAVRWEIPLRILGWGEAWHGLTTKFEGTLKYLNKLPADDIVLFHDAYDVLYLRSPEGAVDLFHKLGHDPMFSGECGCWPLILDGIEACRSRYPEAPTHYRYLNSGTWIATAGAARTLLQRLKNEYDPSKYRNAPFEKANDQELAARAHVAGTYGISLDYRADMLQTAHATDPPLASCNAFSDMTLSHDAAAMTTWVNGRFGTRPWVIHFNGGGKKHHIRADNSMGYRSGPLSSPEEGRRVANTKLDVHGFESKGGATLHDLCPAYATHLAETGKPK